MYMSRAAAGFAECRLSELRKRWQSFNEKRDISSVLVHFDASLLQLLEGERSMVEAVYKLIRQDCRHTHITHLCRETVRDRSFDGLSLAYASIAPMDAKHLLASSNQLPPGSDAGVIDADRARILLFGALNRRRRHPHNLTKVL
jgi:hypothetical protein